MIVARGPDDSPTYSLTRDLRVQRPHVTDLLAAGATREVDHDALTSYFLHWDRWGELFKSIRPILGGSHIDITDGRTIIERKLPAPVSPVWLDEPVESLVVELRKRLLDAARHAAEGQRIVGVLVGGIDSSSVLAALAQVLPPDRIRAMSITGDSGSGDSDADLPYVEELCRHLGVELLTYPWTQDSDPVEEALIADNRPAYAPFMTRRRRWLELMLDAGVEAVLTGTGGDLVFGGDFDELGNRFVRTPIRATQTAMSDVPWSLKRRDRVRWMLSPLVSHLPHRARWPAHYGPRLRKRLRRAASPKTPADRMRMLCTSPYIVTSHLYNHALMQGFDVVFRDVTLHSPLLAFLSSVPIDKLNCDGRFRGLLHRAIAPWVTPRVANRRTKSYQDPLVKMRPSTEQALRELAHGTRLEAFGYANGPPLLEAFDRGDRNAIWRFLTVEAWLRENT